jgi:hypothetical protein
MVQLSSMMWILAAFFGIVGFMRGWNREVIALAGILLSMFALFQFDALIRGTILLSFSYGQTFFIQMAAFLTVVFFAYRNRSFVPEQRTGSLGFQSGFLGGIVGCLNGYLIGGTLWYFLDINEYPLAPYVMAPGVDSPAAHSLGTIPLVIMSGGLTGSGDTLVVGVVILFLIVLMII